MKKNEIFKVPLLLLLLFVFACNITDPLNTQFKPIEDGELYKAKSLSNPPIITNNLKVMTWNIKYGGGNFSFYWEKDGTKYNMTQEEVYKTLKGIVGVIKKENPDILILQEVDKSSKWSAYINMCQYILDETDFNYGSYAPIIKGDIVPSDGMQKLNMGNFTVSKWPIVKSTRYNLPMVPGLSALTSYFYFNRNLLVAETEIPKAGKVSILNIHTEPFDERAKDNDHTKKKHIDFFKAKMDELVKEGKTVVGGGDFNVMPNNSDKWEGFPDADGELAKKANYVGEESWMDGLMTDYSSALTKDDFKNNDTPGIYTFPATYSGNTTGKGAWNRTLDFLFTNKKFNTTRVLQKETYDGLLSDHAPIVTIMELK